MIPEAPDKVAVVSDKAGLAALVDRLRQADWVALDTEFMRERTYFPQLCLIQVATADDLACIDPMACEDLTPLAPLLADTSVIKVFHAASQDLEVLYQAVGEMPRPVFDTQVAAALLGHADQIGYARLVEDVLGVRLEKAHSRTDWSRRPLSADEIDYAADDVRYLTGAYTALRDELEARGRLAWLAPEFEAMTDPARYTPDPDNAWRRVKGVRKLRAGQQRALAQLAAWRERTAVDSDRPRGWIIKDDVLVDLARRRPRDAGELARVRGLADATRRKQEAAILACIAAAADEPSEALIGPGQPLDAGGQALVDLLTCGLKARAAEAEISAGALATRKDLESLVSGERDLPILRGWRRAAAGERLLALLEGRALLRADGNSVVLEEVPVR